MHSWKLLLVWWLDDRREHWHLSNKAASPALAVHVLVHCIQNCCSYCGGLPYPTVTILLYTTTMCTHQNEKVTYAPFRYSVLAFQSSMSISNVPAIRNSSSPASNPCNSKSLTDITCTSVKKAVIQHVHSVYLRCLHLTPTGKLSLLAQTGPFLFLAES